MKDYVEIRVAKPEGKKFIHKGKSLVSVIWRGEGVRTVIAGQLSPLILEKSLQILEENISKVLEKEWKDEGPEESQGGTGEATEGEEEEG